MPTNISWQCSKRWVKPYKVSFSIILWSDKDNKSLPALRRHCAVRI
jgi:hypothetical protein